MARLPPSCRQRSHVDIVAHRLASGSELGAHAALERSLWLQQVRQLATVRSFNCQRAKKIAPTRVYVVCLSWMSRAVLGLLLAFVHAFVALPCSIVGPKAT